MELKISKSPLLDASKSDELLRTLPGATIYQTVSFAESLKRNNFFDTRYIYVLELDL